MKQENENIEEYKNYLIKILGYSQNTARVYLFYIEKLLRHNNDYKSLMNSHIKQSNNTKRVELSAIKNYYKFINNECYKEIILPKKDKVIEDYVTYSEYLQLTKAYHNKSISK